jgi:uncharacterized membrane protein
MTENERNQAEWENAANWSRGLYTSRFDTRLFVPKRHGGRGTTLNFGHRAWGLAMLALMIVPVALLFAFLVSQVAR